MAGRDYAAEIDKKRRKKAEEETASSATVSKSRDYASELDVRRYAKTAKIDTLGMDLQSLSTTLNSLSAGWQTPETMKNTRNAIQSMKTRLNAYESYRKITGSGTDLNDLASGYQEILEDWDERAKAYGKYDSKESYDNAMKLAEEALKRREGMKTANLEEHQTEIDRLEGFKSNEYFKEFNEASKIRQAAKSASGRNGYVYNPKNNKIEDRYLDEFLAREGYADTEALQKDIVEKTQYLNQAEWVQKGIQMSSVGDKSSENYDKDFDTKSKPKSTKKKTIFGTEDYADYTHAYINDIEGSRNDALAFTREGNSGSYLQEVGYEYMTDQEKKTYNYYYNEHGKEKAEEYLHTIREDLGARKANADFKKYEGNTAKELLFSINAGLDQFNTGIGNLFNGSDEYIPVNATQQLSGMIREDLDEVGFDNFLGLGSSLGQAVYDLGTTTANMAPSILAYTVANVVLPGSGALVGAGLMGGSAAGNAYQEKLNQGWDKSQARVYSTAIGVSEGALQYALGGIGKLGGKLSGKSIEAMATGIDNALARFFAVMPIKMASEFTEESLQEVIAPFIENLALGYAKNNWSDVDLAEVAYSGMLGALSAGLLEGGGTAVNTFGENHSAKGLGATIRGNKAMADVFDIASLTPKESTAYNLYTQYAKKGVNSENASDVQLGRLFLHSDDASRGVLGSKKSTLSQQESAKDIQKRLSAISEEKALDKGTISKIEESVNQNKAYRDGLISAGLESGENTESHKLAKELDAKRKNGEDISAKSLAKLAKANENAIKLEEYAEAMSEEDAGVFLEQYDGTTDIEEYHTNFTYVNTLADNAVDVDEALAKVTALTPSQVGAIYNAKILASDAKPLQVALDNLKAKHKGSAFVEGSINDVIIDYRNSTTDGSKVNWKDLTARQQKAVRFAKAFAKATGVNIMFTRSKIVDGKHKGENGSYNPETNTITLDVFAGRIDASTTEDAIIPTLSHELTHWMKAKSPAIYKAISEDVMQILVASGELSRNEIIANEIDRIKKRHGKEASADYAMDEIVARACEDMLSHSNKARKLLAKMTVEEQQTFNAKVKETLENLIRWVNELLGYYKSDSAEAKTLREYKKNLKAISKMWDEMLVSAIEANQALQKEGVTGEALAKAENNADVGEVQYASRIDKKRKSPYNEFNSIAMQWANHPDTKPGDLKILNRNGKQFVLLEATNNGFVELKSGKYTEVEARYERIHREKDRSFYAYTQEIRSKQDGNMWDMQYVGDGGYASRDGEQIGSGGLQTDSARNDEYLRSSYKGELVSKGNEDIKFSMRENVEETKELVAVHNLSPAKFLKTLKLGGLPMPSIAITRAREGYNNFGEISLVFNKDTIDPQLMRSNKVYSGDAWTPTYPQINYKVNEKVQKNIKKKIDALVPSNIQSDLGGLHLDVDNVEHELNRHGDMATSYRYNYAMKYAFLKDNGVNIELPTEEKPFYRHGEVSNSAVVSFANKLVDGLKTANSLLEQHSSKLMADTDLINSIATVLNEEVLSTIDENSEAYQKFVENYLYKPEDVDFSTVLGMLEASRKYFNSNGKTEFRIDYRKATEKLNEYFDSNSLEKEYEFWLKKLFADIVDKEGIRNNKDLFTPSGNRRSFEALHYEHTLENVIKAMKESGDKGIGGFGGGNIFGASTKEYASIDDMKADSKNRMKWMPPSEYENIKAGFRDRFFELANSLPIHKDSFSALDDATNMLVEAVSKFKTKSGMANYLRSESKGWANYNDYIVDDLIQLVNEISQMPVEYFEAKPQRAVGLDEIRAVIMPEQSSYEDDLSEIKEILNGHNIPIIEYEYGDNNARLKALNSIEDVKFSDRDYSYEAIVSKPDMKLTVIDGNVPSTRADIVKMAKKNALKIGKFNAKDSSVSVFVDDIGKDIILGAEGLRHGLRRSKNLSTDANSIATIKAGEIIKNSIQINELTPKNQNADSSYVLIGGAKNTDGNLYIVQSVINQFSNELISMDVLYAVNAKKENRLRSMRPEILPSVTDSTISIAELLDYVNKYFPDILPESVLRHYGYDARPEGELGEDVLFSDRITETVYDKMGETKRLEKETERLKKDLGRLKERLSIEGKVTGGTAVLSKDTDVVAGHIRKIANSTFSKDNLSAELKDFYTYMRESSLKGTWNDEAVFAKAYELAENVLTEAKPKTVPNDYAKFLLKEIRSKRISLSESQMQEAQNAFGKDWRNAFWGKVVIANDGISLDSQWQEWASTYPDFFKADVTEADQITELYKIYEDLRDVSEIVQEYDAEEQTRWLAEEIINKCWTLPIRFTIADKYDARIKALNFEHRQAMKEMRDDYEKRAKEQHKADKARYKGLVDKVRDRKDAEIAEAKRLGKERLNKYKEEAERKTKIQSITANALTLNKWLTKNSKDEHIHEAMKAPVIELLQAIDFSSKQLLGMRGGKYKGTPTQKDVSLSKALGKVKDMMVSASNAKEELIELYGHGLDEEIVSLADSVDTIMRTVGDNEFVLNQMSLEELHTLDKIVSTIKHAVTKINKFHTINHARGIANLSQEAMSFLDSLGMEKLYKGIRGGAKKLLNWGNALPYYAFKRYGSAGAKVFEAFQDGWDKFAFHIKAIMDYADAAYTNKEVRQWEKDVKGFKVRIPATDLELADPNYKPKYQNMQITVPQIMSLYCLMKREQAKGHILGGGIRVTDIEAEKGQIISQPDGVTLTLEGINTIVDSLTNRQREVADKLQDFMNTTCAEWGNEVSMLRFGYKAFGEENYFPIQSDKNNLAVDSEETRTNSLFALLNMSFTKSTIEKANNRIVISDIFDVFAQHTSDMAKYNALALPVLDAFKWYNYTEKELKGNGTFITTGVKQSMEKAFGKDGVGYFTTFLKDINGEKEISRDTLGKHFFSSAKVASVAANLRVVLLQPTSYVRANAVINNRYLASALIHKPKIKKAEQYCGMALWKSMGYYDTNIQKGVEEQIKHNESWKDKATDLFLKGAEWADKLTWGYLWNACELEVRKTRKDLKVGSEEFYQAIGNRLREVIYATQVVDSTMTRSQMMRSSQLYDKMLTAFASEPTLAYNMVQDAYMGYKLDARQMGKKEAIKKNGKMMARVMIAYTMTNALAALVESGFDAFRDDEDEEKDLETFMKLYLSNFAYDMSFSAKVPYVKELISILQGFTSSRTDTQWMQSAGYALKGITKMVIEGEGDPASTVKHCLRTFSYLSGLPIYNIYRDTLAALDKFGLFTTEDLEEMYEDIFN